jgi:hypothetical protein
VWHGNKWACTSQKNIDFPSKEQRYIQLAACASCSKKLSKKIAVKRYF